MSQLLLSLLLLLWYSDDGIHVATVQVSLLVYGGDNIKAEDYDVEVNNINKKRVGDAYVQLAQGIRWFRFSCIIARINGNFHYNITIYYSSIAFN